jgi:hypothetical protein
LENSEIVTTATALPADCRVSHRRRVPSPTRNHSGWATNDRSWMATTTGIGIRSGALYAGANQTSR